MKETRDIISLLSGSLSKGEDVALATIISSSGSTPRSIGSKMIVYPNGRTAGTVGGGSIEALVIRKALECLKKGESGKFKFVLSDGGNTGMICGGEVEVFIEVYKKPFKVIVLGSGHVALQLSRALDVVGSSYVIADDRKEFVNRENYPNAVDLILKPPHEALKKLDIDEKCYIIIVTRGHALDKECLARAMKTKASYIGMIGSRLKVKKTFDLLKRGRINPYEDERIFSPVGLDLGGDTPGEIAVSIVAEILKVHYKRSAGHMRDR